MRTELRVRRASSAVAALLVATGCNGTTSYLDATGRAGRQEAVLGQWLTGVASAVVLLVIVALVLGITRRRDEAASSAQRHNVRTGLAWIYWGIGATVAILLVTFVGTMVTLNAASRPPTTPAITLDVTGHQWWWEIRYSDPAGTQLGFVTANEIHLPVGRPVRVRLQSVDVIHSFWLPQIAGKTDVVPGQVNEMWLQADRPGASRGPCGEYCGLQHANMSLTVTAESPADFAAWAAARRAPARAPVSADAAMGAAVFRGTCGACHAVSGTEALGRFGPDLTHVASRPYLGAGALANTPANLERWIANAPGIKEGARMPAIALRPGEMRGVVAYLATLR